MCAKGEEVMQLAWGTLKTEGGDVCMVGSLDERRRGEEM